MGSASIAAARYCSFISFFLASYSYHYPCHYKLRAANHCRVMLLRRDLEFRGCQGKCLNSCSPFTIRRCKANIWVIPKYQVPKYNLQPTGAIILRTAHIQAEGISPRHQECCSEILLRV